MADMQYHLHAIVATPCGQMVGRFNKNPVSSLQEVKEFRDELQRKWKDYSFIVLFTPEPDDIEGVAESFIPGSVMADSCVYFTIKEEYKL